MSRIIQALKALYVKLGGTASTVADVTQTPDMINAIANLDIGGGGGSSLPAVTSDDNGSVLTVVEGAWDKAEASGGNDFVVNYTDNDGTFTADKTFAEISAAIEAGKNVKALIANQHFTMNYADSEAVIFDSCGFNVNKIYIYEISHTDSNTITVKEATITPDTD